MLFVQETRWQFWNKIRCEELNKRKLKIYTSRKILNEESKLEDDTSYL